MMLLNRLREITESIIRLDSTVGFWKVVRYVLLGLFILAMVNFRGVAKFGVEFFNELSEEIHNEKMERRDELLSELEPILKEYRVATDADRILFFEYHNSKENLVGIPFKYIDLILQDTKYGMPQAHAQNLVDINVGVITTLYEDIKYGRLVYHYGDRVDTAFANKYKGALALFTDIGSKQQVFISIPGIRQPIGLIVLEWLTDESVSKMSENKVDDVTSLYRPRINALIMSKKK